jgi:D-ribose pyranase
MVTDGIVNPQVASLLCRIRHTNALVIADVAFPFWPQIETVDLSLTRGVPTIPQVLEAVLQRFKVGSVYMAEEFNSHNDEIFQREFLHPLGSMKANFEPHVEFKKRVPAAVGLIRTGDPTMYGNLILVSA